MAKKLKEVRPLKADDLKKGIEEINRQGTLASEYAGSKGKVTRDLIDRYGLDRRALSFVVGLAKADEQKRQASLRAVIDYAAKLEFFDQMDAFDDVIDTLAEIVEKARGNADEDDDAPAAPGPVGPDAKIISEMLN